MMMETRNDDNDNNSNDNNTTTTTNNNRSITKTSSKLLLIIVLSISLCLALCLDPNIYSNVKRISNNVNNHILDIIHNNNNNNKTTEISRIENLQKQVIQLNEKLQNIRSVITNDINRIDFVQLEEARKISKTISDRQNALESHVNFLIKFAEDISKNCSMHSSYHDDISNRFHNTSINLRNQVNNLHQTLSSIENSAKESLESLVVLASSQKNRIDYLQEVVRQEIQQCKQIECPICDSCEICKECKDCFQDCSLCPITKCPEFICPECEPQKECLPQKECEPQKECPEAICPEVATPACPEAVCPEVATFTCPEVATPTCPEAICPEVATPTCPEVATFTCPEVATPTCPEAICPEVATPTCPEAICPEVATPTCLEAICPEVATPACPEVATPTCPEVATPTCPEVATPTCPEVVTPECPFCDNSKNLEDFSLTKDNLITMYDISEDAATAIMLGMSSSRNTINTKDIVTLLENLDINTNQEVETAEINGFADLMTYDYLQGADEDEEYVERLTFEISNFIHNINSAIIQSSDSKVFIHNLAQIYSTGSIAKCEPQKECDQQKEYEPQKECICSSSTNADQKSIRPIVESQKRQIDDALDLGTDFASVRNGAYVMKSSETYLPQGSSNLNFGSMAKGLLSKVGVKSDWIATNRITIPDPSYVLQNLGLESGLGLPHDVLTGDMTPGSCWPMIGYKGFITIKLASSISPVALAFNHLHKSDAKDISTAPKHFEVYMNLSNNQNIHFDGFYDITKASSLQLFDFPTIEDNDATADTITVVINSNYGNNDYTCIYSISVYGRDKSSY